MPALLIWVALVILWLASLAGGANAAIHTSTAPPATPGVVQLTAIARDALGQETTSPATTIRLYAPGTAGITYYHHDLAGSVIGATDALGAVLWQESYLPYGERLEPRSTPDSTDTAQQGGNRLWFHGKAEDAESGLQYFGARYYDPVIGSNTNAWQ